MAAVCIKCYTCVGRFWPLKLPWRYPNCKAEQGLCHKATGVEKRVLVTSEGNDMHALLASIINVRDL